MSKKLKIGEVRKLILSDQNVLIKDVSDSVGFSDQHYFSKVFKAHVGLSPIGYKNKVNFIVLNYISS